MPCNLNSFATGCYCCCLLWSIDFCNILKIDWHKNNLGVIVLSCSKFHLILMTTYLNVKSVFTISFACRVCEHQAEHNMDGRNLSRCWWPTIMRMEFASYEAMLQFSMYPEEIILTLIQQCNFFFFGGDEVWKSLNMYSCKASVLSESLAVNNSASQAPVTSFWNLVVFLLDATKWQPHFSKPTYNCSGSSSRSEETCFSIALICAAFCWQNATVWGNCCNSDTSLAYI